MWVLDLIGSLGLFLLGMWLMTEGLRLAGGEALQSLLGRWTSTRMRGLLAGMLVTALVQSSSAVTVATIGFVNAGLMAFQQSVWVIFGSNVGTTLTAWLVTLFGFSIDIETVTFPLFGIGAFLRVFSPYKRGQALGEALAGFGLLFMGIDALQSTFEGAASQIDMSRFDSSGFGGLLLGLGVGLLLTLVTQSSSAAIALILTAVASGLVQLNVATAAVIGANIGTTSTALIATVGATPNARRLAFAHVTFNVITGVVALLLVPVFLRVTAPFVVPDSQANLTLLLAIFHTSFNMLGVALMLPIEPTLSRRLLRMFEKPRPDQHPHTTLDRNVAAVPDLAIRALTIELGELQNQVGNVAVDELVQKEHTEPEYGLGEERETLASLKQRLDGVDQFITLISQSGLTQELSARLTAGYAANHYLRNSHDTLVRVAELKGKVAEMDSHVFELLNSWLKSVTAFAGDITHTDTEYQATHWSELLAVYMVFKQDVLSAVVSRGVDVDSVETALFIGSLSRRYIEQLLQVKQGYSLLLGAKETIEVTPATGAGNSTPTAGEGAAAPGPTQDSVAAGAGADGSPPADEAAAVPAAGEGQGGARSGS